MTKIAIISDIHGNYIALKAAFKDMEKKGVNKIYCLGDIALKYGEPGKTADAIRRETSGVVRGNVDDYLVNRFKNNQSPSAKKDILINQTNNIDNINWLENLPFFQDIQVNGQKIRLVHASPLSNDRLYNPEFDNSFNERYSNKIITSSSEFFDTPIEGKSLCYPDIVFFGHTHVPKYEKTSKGLIINPGSIGDPIIPQKINNMHVDSPSPEISYVIIDGKEQVLNAPFPKEKIKIQCIHLPYLPILSQMKSEYSSKTTPIFPSTEERMNKFYNELKEQAKTNEIKYHGEEDYYEYESGRKL